jgi:hypothetical protein
MSLKQLTKRRMTPTAVCCSSLMLLLFLLQLSHHFGMVVEAFHVPKVNRGFPSPARQEKRTIIVSSSVATSSRSFSSHLLSTGDDENDTTPENPYADPNYPELEFVNYADPEYAVDQGVSDEFFDTEEKVEEMREERRVRNDEFQFETYFKDILKQGQEFKGEWMVYRTSTFTGGEKDASGRPRLAKAVGPLKVISKGERITLDKPQREQEHRLTHERILHHEMIFSESDDDNEDKKDELKEKEERIMGIQFWPQQLSSKDFRGHQGIMCVGNAYTISTAVPLVAESSVEHEGPFAEYRAELGLLSDVMRFRIKLDYSVVDEEKESMKLPPLHLRSLTVCRETLGMWPRAEKYKSAIEAVTEEGLWGQPGAHGGLYDPPPVGSEEQANQYLLLDLEGRATVLLPYLMDQDPEKHPDSGWVTSLDWTPGTQRYQLDRKTRGGKDLLGLRTLELSEVQSADADTYRPRDGGANMRQ